MQGANLFVLVDFEVGLGMAATEDVCFLQTLAAAISFPLPNKGALDLEKGALFTTAGECFTLSPSNAANRLGAGRRDKSATSKGTTLRMSTIGCSTVAC